MSCWTERRVVVVGCPGVGKTALIQAIQSDEIANNSSSKRMNSASNIRRGLTLRKQVLVIRSAQAVDRLASLSESVRTSST